jgi:aspartyl-tRNA(Asn)/glutamyl-tRNA(Gln) amidotransferase subunit A
VEDVAATMAILAGPDPDDPTALTGDPPSFDVDQGKGLRGMRVGIPRELMAFPVQPEVARRFEAALAIMRDLGAEVREVSIPLLGRASWINGAIVPPETAAQHSEWSRTWFPERPVVYGQDVAASLAKGRGVPATDFIEASRLRSELRQALAKIFSKGTDFLVTPTQAITAPQIGEQTVILGGREIDVLDTMIHFLCAFSITGLPALSLPMGLANGLPAGLQVIGPFLRDRAVLQACLAMQEVTRGDRLCATNPAMAH